MSARSTIQRLRATGVNDAVIIDALAAELDALHKSFSDYVEKDTQGARPKRAWMLAVSAVLGATAGWAGYFAWAYRNLIPGKELLWGATGAAIGFIVYAVTRRG
jgi:hypothetical protein